MAEVGGEASVETSAVINNNVIKEKINKNIYKILKESRPSKNVLWNYFSIIVDEKGNEISFVSCDDCKKVLSRNKHTTSNLLHHP